MKNEAKANEEADKEVRERVEKLNMADGLIFNSEKQLKEYGDKIPEDKKTPIETAINELREAHKAEDIARIDTAVETLNGAWAAASEHMYAQGQDGAGAADGGAQQGQPAGEGSDAVADAEYEEVK